MSARDVLAKTLAEIETETMPCPRCNGYGYHHGFGEHGHDPDWCVQCQGPGFVMVHDATKTPEILIAALSASGYVIVPREPTGEMIQAAILTHVSENKGIEHAPYLSWKAMIAALHPAKDETK